jgi:hypothetical protein
VVTVLEAERGLDALGKNLPQFIKVVLEAANWQ